MRAPIHSATNVSESRDPQKQRTEQATKIRAEYERKLTDLRGKLKQVQSVEREHQRMSKQQHSDQQRLSKLQTELAEMKKAKVAGAYGTMRNVLAFMNWASVGILLYSPVWCIRHKATLLWLVYLPLKVLKIVVRILGNQSQPG